MLLKILKALVLAGEQEESEKEERIVNRIVMAIDDKIKTFADAMNANLDAIAARVTNVAGDVRSLLEEIAALKAMIPDLSPEAQASLNGILAHGAQVLNNIASLDESVPPPTPPPAA